MLCGQPSSSSGVVDWSGRQVHAGYLIARRGSVQDILRMRVLKQLLFSAWTGRWSCCMFRGRSYATLRGTPLPLGLPRHTLLFACAAGWPLPSVHTYSECVPSSRKSTSSFLLSALPSYWLEASSGTWLQYVSRQNHSGRTAR